MAKRVEEQVIVTLVRNGDTGDMEPVSFVWRGARFHVDLSEPRDTWEEVGRWWEREMPATAWRVQLRRAGAAELLMYHTKPPIWMLMKIWD